LVHRVGNSGAWAYKNEQFMVINRSSSSFLSMGLIWLESKLLIFARPYKHTVLIANFKPLAYA